MHQEAYPLRTPFLSRRSIATAAVALVVGAGAAVGIYALVDDDATVAEPATRVIVSTPVAPGEGTAAKNEAGVAAAVGEGANPSSRTHPPSGEGSIYVNPSTGQAAPATSGHPSTGEGAASQQYLSSPSSQYRVNPSTGQPYPGLSDQAQQAEGTTAKNEAATAAAVGSGSHQHGE